MQIEQISIPADSLIEKNEFSIDYSDCFSGQFHAEQPVALAECVRYCLNNWPTWIMILLRIRNFLVIPFGLITSTESEKDHRYPVISISKGSQARIFEVAEFTNEEVLLFVTDKHLDAWLSIIIKDLPGQQEIIMSTAVKFHNLIGKIYFFFINPFHKVIVRSLLNRVIIYFNSNNT
jgi:hypothetical protein